MTTTAAGRIVAYIGTHTDDPQEGIHMFELDPSTGALTACGVAGGLGNPFFLTIDRSHRFMYVANAVRAFAGTPGGSVLACRIEPGTGALTRCSEQAACGHVPCYVSVTADRRCVLVANYTSGNLAVLPVGADGGLAPASCTVQHEGASVDPGRQEGPHVHSIVLEPAGRFAFAADLGTDQVRIYQVDAAAGTLVANPAQPYASVAPGSGPRHIVFDAAATHMYLINELSNTITVFDYDAGRGTLAEIQTLATLPTDYAGTSYCADLLLHPSGRYLYGTNRGHDSMVVCAVDPESGRLDLVDLVATEGNFPWNLGLDPTGRFLLVTNQGEGTVTVFALDEASGVPRFTGHQVAVPKPVCAELLQL